MSEEQENRHYRRMMKSNKYHNKIDRQTKCEIDKFIAQQKRETDKKKQKEIRELK